MRRVHLAPLGHGRRVETAGNGVLVGRRVLDEHRGAAEGAGVEVDDVGVLPFAAALKRTISTGM